MKLADILIRDPVLEMAYTQKRAETIITDLEKPVNDHLLKIWTVPESVQRDHWLTELVNWIDEISEIILKPSNRRPSADFYYRILFDEPFGGAELANLMSRLRRLKRQGHALTTSASPEDLLDRLRTFHEKFARQAADGPVSEAALHELIG